MNRESKTEQKSHREIAELRARLEEAEETLRALRGGEVDAVIVGEQVYLLESAEAASNRLRGDALALVQDAVIVVDNENRVTYLNPAAERQYGLTASETLGRALTEVYQPRWLRPEDEAAFAALHDKGYWRGENIHVKRTGEPLYVESSVSLLRDDSGAITGKLAIIRDSSERHQAEAALRQSEERFALATQAVGAVIYDWQIVPDRIERSRELINLLGFAPDEPGVATNLWYRTRLHPDDDVRARQVITDAIARHAPRFEDEHRVQHKDGHYIWVRDSGVLLYDEHGTAVRSVGSIRNIDQRKQVEEALRESEDRFRHMADHAPVMIWMTETDGTRTYLSQSWYEFTGQTPETGLGFGWLDATHPDDKGYAEKAFLTANENHEAFRVEYRLRRTGGSYAWAIDSAQPRFDANGAFLGYIGSVLDITERKQAEENLKYQTTLLEALTESVLDGILIVSIDGRMLYSNQRFVDIWNFPPEVIASRSDQRALEWAAEQTLDPAAFRARVKAVYDQPDGELREEVALKDGRVFDRFGAPIQSGAVQYGWVWTFRDITERKNAEAKLIESENRLRRAVAESPFPTIIHDEDDRILEVSKGWTNYSGYTIADIPTITAWTERAYGEKQAFVKEYIDHLFEANETVPNGEWIINTKDGSQRVWDFFTTPLGKSAGGRRLLLSIAADVTERKQAAEQLRRNHETFFKLVKNTPFGIYIIDADFRLLQISAGSQKVFSRIHPLIGRDFAEILRTIWEEPFASEAIAHFRHTLATGEPYRAFDTTEQRGDIKEIESYDWKIERIVLPDGNFGVVCYFYDLTKQKQVEAALQKSEAEFRQLANTVPQIVWVANGGGKMQYVNEQWMDFSGLTLEETDTPEIVAEVIHPDDRELVFGKWAQAFKSGTPYELEARMRNHKTGEYVWFLMRSEPTKDASGKVVRWFGTSTDITTTKEAEKALRASEQKQRLAIEAAAMTTWELNLKTGARTLGANYAEVFGSAPQTTQEFLAVIHPNDRERVKAAVQAAAQGEQPYRLQYRTIDSKGAIQWVESFGHLTYDEAGAPAMLLGVVMNITKRKVAEERIKTANYRFRVAEEAAQGFNYEWNLVTGAVTRSESIERVLGYPREALAQTWQAWAELVHPDDLTRKTDAETVAFLRNFQQETLSQEYRVRHRDGHYVWVMERALIIRDERDEAYRVIGQIMDVTARKEAEVERERLLAQEQQARATAEAATRAKDEFLAVVSHELRNPLNAILGYTRMARTQAHDQAAVVRHCEIVERSAKMQQQLIEDLLDTARIISGKLKIEAALTDLRLVLEDALSVVLPAASAKQIDVVSRLGDEPQLVIGDAARLQQVAWNLLQNAIKFTPSGGRVELRLERDHEQVYIVVSDSGQGIEPEFLNAVFDRFSQRDMARTRRHGGLGLGLALVKDLVALHGGTVTVTSAGTGQGATFTITLPPRAPQVVAAPPPLRAIAEVRTGSEAIPLEDLPRLDNVRVLVVDDQEEAREIVAATLSEWGAAVTTAASGAAARERLAEQPFDVLVCDISMPDEDGYEVIGQIRALEYERGVPFAQRLPAVALTALARPEDRWQALSAGFQMHVAKPVELAELVVVINSLTHNGSRAQN